VPWLGRTTPKRVALVCDRYRTATGGATAARAPRGVV
jgi:hypothetical protein